jgi:hypothetical protein
MSSAWTWARVYFLRLAWPRSRQDENSPLLPCRGSSRQSGYRRVVRRRLQRLILLLALGLLSSFLVQLFLFLLFLGKLFLTFLERVVGFGHGVNPVQ